jgi:hypothetical protein
VRPAGLDLGELPKSVTRHLTQSELGRQERAHASVVGLLRLGQQSLTDVLSGERSRESRPLRLRASSAGQALSLLLQTEPAPAAAVIEHTRAAIVGTFAAEPERLKAALLALAAVEQAATKREKKQTLSLLAELDSLIYAFCRGSEGDEAADLPEEMSRSR